MVSHAIISKLTLSEADPDAAFEVQAFHAHVTDPNDPNLVERTEIELRLAAENGLLFVVRDGATIVAAAGVFDIADGYVELGGTGVDKGFRGFGLQRLLAITRIAATVAQQGKLTDQTSAIKPSNAPSLRNMKSVGFVPWDHPIPEMFGPCSGCSSRSLILPTRSCCCDYYKLPKPQQHWNVATFLAAISTSGAVVTLTNKGGQHLDIEMQTIVATGPHRQDLEDYRRTGP